MKAKLISRSSVDRARIACPPCFSSHCHHTLRDSQTDGQRGQKSLSANTRAERVSKKSRKTVSNIERGIRAVLISVRVEISLATERDTQRFGN